MPKYSVTLPICGHIIMEVEAEDKEKALRAAEDMATTADIEEWSFHYGCEGNVCSFPNPWAPEVEEFK